jgi:hypothetical protein
MAGYLDQYGVGVDRRNRIVKWSIFGGLTALILGTLTWYLLENHHQESVVKLFIRDVKAGDYDAAYRDWGCTAQKSCPGYSIGSLLEDWGGASKDPTKSSPPDPAIFALTDSESCNNGVLLTVQVNPTREEKLWVDKGSDSISYAPYPICPHKNPFAIMLHRTVGRLRIPLLK